MNRSPFRIVFLLLVSAAAFGQTFTADTESAIVWSERQCVQSDTLLGGHESLCDGITTSHPEASSIVQDPLTGHSLRKIKYEGVEVLSTLASYDVGCGWSECHTAYCATFTIINNTEMPLQLDGSTFTSTLRAPTAKEIRSWWGKKSNPTQFVPSSGTIQPGQSTKVFGYMVASAQGSNVTRWFNHTPVDVIPIRYSIKLRGKDFVFPWLAPVNREFDAVPQWDY